MKNIAFSLLQDVVNKLPTEEVATILGLHQNTITRWFENEKVPNHYISDFKRMLGRVGEPDDQFYTKPTVAANCYFKIKDVISDLGIDFDKYWIIEPSAGCGAFFNLLPEEKRIGLDLYPTADDKSILKKDYLFWTPKLGRKYIVIGNPPFGLRGHLALQFINHSAKFADVVAFILPQLFESDGKGVPAKRVDSELRLAFSERLPADSFHRPCGKDIGISTIFQVWTKIAHDKIKIPPRKSCKSFIKIYSLSDGGTPASTRNKRMIGNCDIYLPSTCFAGMQSYLSFDELPNKRGYGIVILNQAKKIFKVIREHDWTTTAFTSTNGAVNLRSSLIEDVIMSKGFCDD